MKVRDASRGHDVTVRGLSALSPSVSPLTSPAVYQPHYSECIPLPLNHLFPCTLLGIHLSHFCISPSLHHKSCLFFFPSPCIPLWCEPSRGSILFFSPSLYLTACCGSGGSRFLIPETCPSMDAPPPSATDLASDPQCYKTSRSPNCISAPPQRRYTSAATPTVHLILNTHFF